MSAQALRFVLHVRVKTVHSAFEKECSTALFVVLIASLHQPQSQTSLRTRSVSHSAGGQRPGNCPREEVACTVTLLTCLECHMEHHAPLGLSTGVFAYCMSITYNIVWAPEPPCPQDGTSDVS